MSEFKPEIRYAVIKLSDAEKYLSDDSRAQLIDILAKIERSRINDGKNDLECVVVERNWPEYELVWNMLRQRAAPQGAV